MANFLPLYQMLIYRIYIFPWLCQYGEKLHQKLANKGSYWTIICSMKLRLCKLQAKDPKAQEFR